jgi:hypothetical protein
VIVFVCDRVARSKLGLVSDKRPQITQDLNLDSSFFIEKSMFFKSVYIRVVTVNVSKITFLNRIPVLGTGNTGTRVLFLAQYTCINLYCTCSKFSPVNDRGKTPAAPAPARTKVN